MGRENSPKKEKSAGFSRASRGEHHRDRRENNIVKRRGSEK